MELEFNAPEGGFPPELVRVLRDVGYKSGYTLFLQKDIPHAVYYDLYIMPSMFVLDVCTGQPVVVRGLPVHAGEEDDLRDLLRRIFESLENLEVHECAEQFSYRGVRVCNPHLQPAEQEALWDEALGLNVLAGVNRVKETPKP